MPTDSVCFARKIDSTSNLLLVNDLISQMQSLNTNELRFRICQAGDSDTHQGGQAQWTLHNLKPQGQGLRLTFLNFFSAQAPRARDRDAHTELCDLGSKRPDSPSEVYNCDSNGVLLEAFGGKPPVKNADSEQAKLFRGQLLNMQVIVRIVKLAADLDDAIRLNGLPENKAVKLLSGQLSIHSNNGVNTFKSRDDAFGIVIDRDGTVYHVSEAFPENHEDILPYLQNIESRLRDFKRTLNAATP